MKIVILGFNSFVGSAIASHFSSMIGVELIHVGRKESDSHEVVKFEVVNDTDVLDESVDKLIAGLNLDNDSIVINCISMGDVDRCEVDKEDCKVQNHLFVELLYNHLKNYNFKKLIHFSTNAVYDGENAPYGENSQCRPINFYGLVKLKADEFLLCQQDPRVMVVRPITMYGRVPNGGRGNPTSMIIKKLQDGQNLKLVNDVLVNILYIGDLVRAVEKLIAVDFSGLINISGNTVYSRYELGLKISELIDAKKALIESVTSAEFETIADRPLDTSFNNTLMKKMGIRARTLEQTIDSLL